jgi:ankyrin repeat protein
MSAIIFYLDSGGDINGRSASGSTLLIEAARAEQAQLVVYLLSNGASLEQGDSFGDTALHIAAHHSHERVLRILIRHASCKNDNIDILSKAGYTPLMLAARIGNIEATKALLEGGARRDARCSKRGTPLFYAVSSQSFEVATILLTYNLPEGLTCKGLVNVIVEHSVTPLHISAEKKHTKLVQLLLRHGAEVDASDANGMTALHYACLPMSPKESNPEQQYETVRALLKAGAQRDKKTNRGTTPIMHAVYSESTEVIKLLLSANMPQELSPKKLLNIADSSGFTPLLLAAQRHNAQLVKYLIHNGADIRVCQQGDAFTALHHACSDSANNDEPEAVETVKALLDKGARRDSQATNGYTVLHTTVSSAFEEVAKILLTYNLPIHLNKSDFVNMSTHLGITPLMLAAQKDNKNLVELFLNHGASTEATDLRDNTALHYSVSEGHIDSTKMLLKRGADPDVANQQFHTPLYIAVQNYDLPCAKLLLQHGATMTGTDYLAPVLGPLPEGRNNEKRKKMLYFLVSQGALVPGYRKRPRYSSLTQLCLRAIEKADQSCYLAALLEGNSLQKILDKPKAGIRWRDTRIARTFSDGAYNLLVKKAQADERSAFYEANRRLFIAYFADKIQDSNRHYKGRKGVRGNIDALLMIYGLDKTHLPQYPHLTKRDIAQVKTALLNLQSNAYTLAKWRAIQAHMADPGNEEYKGFPGAQEKIAELKAGAAAAAPEGEEAPRALLLSGSGKRGAASRPSAAAASRPAKQAKAMAEADLGEAEKPPKGKRAKRKPN